MTVPIPLLSLSEIETYLEFDRHGTSHVSWPGLCIQGSDFFPEGCFAVRVEEVGLTANSECGLAVFSSQGKDWTALDQMYLVGRVEATPVLRKVVRRETGSDEDPTRIPLAARETRRKSFMTPTPLHVPGSRVSPIPGYTHASLYLKVPEGSAGLEVLPVRDVLWLHPLVAFLPPGEAQPSSTCSP